MHNLKHLNLFSGQDRPTSDPPAREKRKRRSSPRVDRVAGKSVSSSSHLSESDPVPVDVADPSVKLPSRRFVGGEPGRFLTDVYQIILRGKL